MFMERMAILMCGKRHCICLHFSGSPSVFVIGKLSHHTRISCCLPPIRQDIFLLSLI